MPPCSKRKERRAMLRIWLLKNDSFVTVRLEGRLLAPWRDELRRACDRAAADGMQVRLDLSTLHFADASGAELLRSLIRERRIEVGACSQFVAELLAVPAAAESAAQPKPVGKETR